jgi:hypothetical protein
MNPHQIRNDPVSRIQERLTDRLTRTVIDEDGRGWVVYAMPAPDYDRRSGMCLVFETIEVIRKVRVCPPNWYELSEVELYALSLTP